MAIMPRRKKTAKPKFQVGDKVIVNLHAQRGSGTIGEVTRIEKLGDEWFACFDDGEHTPRILYAYKLDLVGRAATFNNQLAFEHLMKGEDC